MNVKYVKLKLRNIILIKNTHIYLYINTTITIIYLAHGRWFSPGTPASSTTKTGRHDIAEILLKVALHNQFVVLFFTVYR
jgi:hypothetical protein